jgi:hypothetical protein
MDCQCCGYYTPNSNHFKKHLTSIKHKINIKEKNGCDLCFKIFSSISNRNRHIRKCAVNNSKPSLIIQTQNIIEAQTNITNNNNTNNNNITNNNTQNIINIIAPSDPSAMKSFVMSLKELQDKKTTTFFQKVILEQMSSDKYDLMDCIEKFDRNVLEAHNDLINNHNRWCSSQRFVTKLGENGTEYEDLEIYTPLTHPEHNWQCHHVESKFKLDEITISTILANTLLDRSDGSKIVVTHFNDLYGESELLFKHKNSLHTNEILLDFLSKSKSKQLYLLSEDFKPASVIKRKYPEYYDTFEAIAINLSKYYNNKMKN